MVPRKHGQGQQRLTQSSVGGNVMMSDLSGLTWQKSHRCRNGVYSRICREKVDWHVLTVSEVTRSINGNVTQ